ncbi:allantoicase [Nocardioidaceae bacterium SCSIO 66511]|nr:allantoicase [Nocardioidaceae bacterium SCSIO 66511]
MTADFTNQPDLAARTLGAGVVYANDELFADRENLIKPGDAVFDPSRFGNKGKLYDGWETRRRREPGSDHAVVRLGVPGVVRGVVVDTAWFKGNFPPYVSIEATSVDGHPSPDELRAADWVSLVDKTSAEGDAKNSYPVDDARRYTHVRLTIYPDGGVARLRVHGEPTPDPRLLEPTVDLAAADLGGRVVDCSDAFYGSASNLLRPDRARHMGEGWENARRRDDGNDFVTVRLAARGVVRRAELDTSYFVGNAPGWASLSGRDGDSDWFELLPRTGLQPDTPHRFWLDGAAPATHVRLDVYPDGGLARLRLHGHAT